MSGRYDGTAEEFNVESTAVQQAKCGNEQGRIEIKLRRHVKKNMTANVFLVLLIVLAKKTIKSADRKLEYYLQCVR